MNVLPISYQPNMINNNQNKQNQRVSFKAGEGDKLVKLLKDNKGKLSLEQLNRFIKDNYCYFKRGGIKNLLEQLITYIAGLTASIESLTATNDKLNKEKQDLELKKQLLENKNQKLELISSLNLDTNTISDLKYATKLLDKLGVNYKIDKDGLLIVDRLELNISRDSYPIRNNNVRNNESRYTTFYPLLNEEYIYKVFPFIKRIEKDLVIKEGRCIVDRDTGEKRIFHDFDLVRDEDGHDAVVSSGWAHKEPSEIEAIGRGEVVPGKIIPVDFSNLESIGGKMECYCSWIKAPKLKTVGKDLIINHCFADLNQVETVGNNLQICGKSYVRDKIFDKDDHYIFSRLETYSQMGNLNSIGGWLQAETPMFPRLNIIENHEINNWLKTYAWWTKKQLG